MNRLLTRKGYQVSACSSAETALDLHLRSPFPFILLDLGLPRIGGVEFTRRIRMGRGGADPYVLVISSNGEPEKLREALSAGVDDYMVKPVSEDLLAVRLAVSERHIAEIRLRRSLEQQNEATRSYVEDIIRSIPDMLLVTDTDGRIRRANQPLKDLVGYGEDEILGLSVNILLGNDLFENLEMAPLARDGSVHNVEAVLRAKDSTEIPVLLSAAQICGINESSDRGVVYVAKDITERVEAEEKVRTLAYYDTLTKLPNRRLMQDRICALLTSAKRHRREIALLFIDIDRFKQVNDSLGHTMGDRLLFEIGRRLKECVRLDDTVARPGLGGAARTVSRFGGDEFTILIYDVRKPEHAAVVAKRILAALALPFQLDDREIYTGASIGIALFPSDGDDADTLLKNADAAMYRAKQQGRNRYQFFTRSMHVTASRQLHLANRLRRALERGEFALHYQPLLNAADGCLSGAEALLRWTLPAEGAISPMEFIPLAEETGEIVAIGGWVLRTACAQLHAWDAAGLRPIRVAVNLSARQLRRESLVEEVAAALRENELDPARLELEITETGMMQENEKSFATLTGIAELGVSLSLDDFGTGYSSLSHMRRFPIRRIKIDRSFVEGITTNSEDATFTEAIIAMAHTLGLKVVGEGVETREQADLLHQQTCDELQGFLFSPGVPAEVFSGFLDGEKEEWAERVLA